VEKLEETSMTLVINGPNGGNAVLFGNTSGDDIINAFDFNNLIISGGANDQITTGAGSATVNLGAFAGVTDTVNVGGAFNTIFTSGAGQFASTLVVGGGTGHNNVNMLNTLGQNSVNLQGFLNTVTVNSDATNILTATGGRNTVSAGKIGDGSFGFSTSITLGGQNNKTTGGDQNFTIFGGLGFDTISVGNGDNKITEAGVKAKITVGTGNNTITDFGGSATIHMVGSVVDDPFETNVLISLGNTNNTVIEDNWALHSARDITISGGTGNGVFILGDGEDHVTTSGANNFIQLGTANNLTSPFDIGEPGNSIVANGDSNTIISGDSDNFVQANGNNDNITIGNGPNNVTANGSNDTITLGNGSNKLTSNGVADKIVIGNGSNNVTANGAGDNIKLGNGNNTLAANGNTDVINIGNGSNNVAAGGNGDLINLGTGNNTLAATGNNDVITSAGGKGTFTLGTQFLPGQDSLTLNASAVGTTVDSAGTQNTITLNNNANVVINDEPQGGSLTVNINATAGNAGKVSILEFENDNLGLINLHGFAGITNFAQLTAVSGSDGLGGTLIHLGTGTLDLRDEATLNSTQFTYV
jgi:hypothetical protein